MTTITMTVLTVLSLLGGILTPQSTIRSTTANNRTGIIFAVDVSANMAGKPLQGEQAAVHALLDTLNQNTPVGLVTFGSHVQIVQQTTTQGKYVEAALNLLHVEGGTALYDGTLTSVKLAAGMSASRRMVVLLSGNPEQAHQSISQSSAALSVAKQYGVSIYSLRWGNNADGAYLQKLASETHAISFALSDKEVQAAVANIAGTAPQVAQTSMIVDVKLTGATQTPQLSLAGAQSAQVKDTTGFVLAIDVSNAMSGSLLRSEQDAARQFIAQATDSTPIALVTYGSQAKLVAPFTIDRDRLTAAINGLHGGNGSAAVYDGTALAINTVINSAVSQRVVLMINGSTEAGRMSKATRQSVLTLAQGHDVEIYGLSLTPKADRTFLQTLATATNGAALDRPTADQLATFYTTICGQPDEVANTSDTSIAASLDTPNTSVGAPNIPPLAGSVAALNLPGTTNVTVPDTTANITSPVDITAAALAGDTTAENAATVIDPSVMLHGNTVPIQINVSDDTQITDAELAVNDYRLATFDKAPYNYDFDTSALRPGEYALTFTVHTAQGVTSTGTVNFDVAIPTVVLPNLGGGSVVTKPGADSVALDSQSTLPQATVLTPAQRVLTINGQVRPFTLDFSLNSGLVVTGSTAAAPKPTLTDILGKPFQYIPQPVREALTAQHPTFWAIVILIMSIIFLPQGLFTLYWMMYTWNNPESAEKYRSPKEYVEPQVGFTAILPARHEQDVIADTIRAVDRINYPDHLKEILIMIRDEDDDETIRRAQQTIDEIGKSSIRIITFTTGPKNKPNGLNRGLAAATKDVVCVFDAEDEPHPDLYNVVNTVMVRDDADVVQSGVQLMNFKSNWFSALNCMEYFFWFKSGLHCFTRALKVTPLGGNTVFFKKHWLQRINGWDENLLTEDADVGLRLSLLGAKIQIVYDEQHATREETPATVDSFIKQRTRWCQGFYEIFFKGDWAKLPTLTQKITAMYILLNSLLQAGLILYLPIGLYIALTQHVSVPVSLLSYAPICILILQLIINLVGIREFAEAYKENLPLGFRLKVAAIYIPYQVLQSVAALRAVHHFVTRKNAWEKTSHANLHRQAQPVVQRSF